MSEKDIKNNENSKQEVDVLDQIKAIELATRKKLLLNVLSDLKEKAKQILTLKEESIALLEAISLSEKDQKRVIDYVNNLEEISLTEVEKKEIRTRTKEQMKKEKKEVEKKIQSDPASAWIMNYGQTNYPKMPVGATTTNEIYAGETSTNGPWHTSSPIPYSTLVTTSNDTSFVNTIL